MAKRHRLVTRDGGTAHQNQRCAIAIDELRSESCNGVKRAARAAAVACKFSPQRLLNHFSDTEQIKRINCGLFGHNEDARERKPPPVYHKRQGPPPGVYLPPSALKGARRRRKRR